MMMMMITMPKLLLCRGGHLICLSSGFEACYCSQIIHVYSTFNEHKRKFCDSQERKKTNKKKTRTTKFFFFIDIFDYIIMELISEIGSWGG